MTKKQRKMLIRIIVCAVMLIALQFIPVAGIPELILYLAAYLIIGYDILKKAGVTKNFTPNYLDGLSPSAYADLYTKIHISPKITNYRLE